MKNNKINSLFVINIILTICLFVALWFLIDIYIKNQNLIKQEQQESLKKQQILDKKLQKLEQEAKYFEEKTKAMEIEFAQEDDNDIFSEEEYPKETKAVFHYDDTKEVVIQKQKKDILTSPKKATIVKQTKKYKTKKKPRLVIIIDDVTTLSQIKKIKQIPYDVTMSFLPPTSRHKKSSIITKNLKHYMIHLPLEAKNRRYEEDNTLHIEDSYAKIEQRIRNLKKLYPRAKYINNHTGSKFTQNKNAMSKLIKALKHHNYFFVDSRTTAKTVARKYAKKYHLKYLTRNVFLDNKREKKYIIKQLKKSIKIAKKKGFAIAIGHPHNITLETLAQSKKMLNNLEIVFIDRLYKSK
jgi:polysaccharide deacetylase 2 family uncharacterized protein YibQ